MAPGPFRSTGVGRSIDDPTEHEPALPSFESPPQASSVFLVVRYAGSVFVVDVADGGTVVFGRSPDAAVRVEEPHVSRSHALLRRVAHTVTIEDLGSRNGTWLNGRRIGPKPELVNGGDVIRVGGAEAVLALTEGGAAPWARMAKQPAAADVPHEPGGGIIVADPGM